MKYLVKWNHSIDNTQINIVNMKSDMPLYNALCTTVYNSYLYVINLLDEVIK